jgi:hypothetical protein
MGTHARFVCLRGAGDVPDLAKSVRGLLKSRHMVEVADPAEAERLLLVAPAGDGWFMVVDRLEELSMSMFDADGLISELCASHVGAAVDVVIADSDDLIMSLSNDGEAQAQLAVSSRGKIDGDLQPWVQLLTPGRTTEDMRAALSTRTTFVEKHFDQLEQLFGLDFAGFYAIGTALSGKKLPDGVELLRFKAVVAPGHAVGSPKLEVDESQRGNFARNNGFPQIPVGLIGHFPAFSFQSRGGGAQGLEFNFSGTAIEKGLVEVVSALVMQRHPAAHNPDKKWDIKADPASRNTLFHISDFKVSDWVHADQTSMMRSGKSLHDFMVWVYVRALKEGDGEVAVEIRLVQPESTTARASYPVTVLPDMWRPLRSSDRPSAIWSVLALNRPSRINCMAVLVGGPDKSVSALQQAIEAWLATTDPKLKYAVISNPEPSHDAQFYSPNGGTIVFTLDRGKSRQTKWNRLLGNLPALASLRLATERDASSELYAELHKVRVGLSYLAPRLHPHLPEFAGRMGHIAISFPAGPEYKTAAIALMGSLAGTGQVAQAYVAEYDTEDRPDSILYEFAADLQRGRQHTVARGWGTRYLRAVADQLWLGPDLAALIPDREALERVATIEDVSNVLAVTRRPEASLRDIELCLAPLLATQEDLDAFLARIRETKPTK